jgi:BirA family transcriptional regulator, biotin operon repressor / biotin---[acetyl-CoA-carboxylase] ligase
LNAVSCVELLDRWLQERGVTNVAWLEVFESVSSTNVHLMAATPVTAGQAAVCLAMAQSAGRGRRGRTWVSRRGDGIYLSIGWTFKEVPRDIACLSLAVGVMVQRALQSLGARGMRLKWPNDLILNGGKLGGVLIEMRTVPGGAYVVVGVGLNLQVPVETMAMVRSLGGLPPRDLTTSGITTVEFWSVSATLIQYLCEGLATFATDGFDAFRNEWHRLDCLRDDWVEWSTGEIHGTGIARGIGDDGALLVEIDGCVDRLVAGEVSLRKVS